METLRRELHRLRDLVQLDELGYNDGHLYCHWCQSSICPHSSPPDPRSVFVGYEPTGTPRWRDFSSWIVERRDARLDRLFTRRPRPLAVFSPGPALVEDLLQEFGKRRGPYRIVAQIAAGFFAIPSPTGETTPIALTIQLIERRTVTGELRFSLNLLSNLPAPHHLPTLLADRVTPLLGRWVESIRRDAARLDRKLEELAYSRQRLTTNKIRDLAARSLHAAIAHLEKALRQKSRRTQHAELRSRDPERPTASAISDTLGATADHFFLDRAEHTVIVRGPRNRVHVFRHDGVHVTSIVYPGATIRDRIRARRWKRLEPHAGEELCRRIRENGTVAEDGDEDPGSASVS